MLRAGDCAHRIPGMVNTMTRQAAASGSRPPFKTVAICVLLEAEYSKTLGDCNRNHTPLCRCMRSPLPASPVDHDVLRAGGFDHTPLRPREWSTWTRSGGL